MEKVLIDTSSILFALSKKIDIFRIAKENKLDVVIYSGTIKELEYFAGKKQKVSVAARVALKIIKERDFQIESGKALVDDWLVNSQLSRNNIVCTNDIALKKRLKEKSIRNVSVTLDGKLK